MVLSTTNMVMMIIKESKMEAYNYAQALGIKDDEVWTEEQSEKIKFILKEKAEVFADMIPDFFMSMGHQQFLLLCTVSDSSRELVSLATLFFHIGYLKGVTDAEETQALDRMVGK